MSDVLLVTKNSAIPDEVQISITRRLVPSTERFVGKRKAEWFAVEPYDF
jgi:hypothetical protein